MSYVDLHLHLLPGVDDGARTEAEALTYAARMAADGVRRATVTPHVAHPRFRFDVRSLPERVRHLQRRLDDAGIPVRLQAGGELHPSGAAELSDAELQLVAQGPPDSRWVLLEVPFAGIDACFLATARAVAAKGFGLVIAHPERAAGLLSSGLPLLRTLLREGAVLQVNVCSLMGAQGPDAEAAATHLLRTRLAYVLASDAHPGRRDQTLGDGRGLAIRAGVSPLVAWQLTQANPQFLLEHGLPQKPAPLPQRAWQALPGQKVEAVRRAARR